MKRNKRQVAKIAMESNKLFPLKLDIVNGMCFIATSNDEVSKLWHDRFGHLNFRSLKEMTTKEIVQGLPKIDVINEVCEECQLGKQHREPFPSKSNWCSQSPLELVHTDLCGPIQVSSLRGSRYFLLFVDDYTRKIWVYCVKEKYETFSCFKDFKFEVEKYYGLKIKNLRSDRGEKYMSSQFKDFCRNHGIRHELTARHSPQQNGVAERKNRTIMNMARCMLKKKNMPTKFWAEAVSCAVYLINRSPTKNLDDSIPNEVWYDSVGTPKWECLNFEEENSLVPQVDASDEQLQSTSSEAETQQNSPPTVETKTRCLRDIYDETEEVDTTDSVYFAFFAGEDPITYEDASSDEKWVHAMNEEIKSIEKNYTWELTSLPSHKSAVGVKWVFKTKTNLDGSINKHKARLVAKD
ncbi:hypothetical protein LIER_34198 [Lithospermum erythrorhizon]|uniref:Integrase catalytic domain-containing protein n=1 Tax=Lithospermum erythrorhizon TaxID=34254 RepID=A0AAV3S185_LITER